MTVEVHGTMGPELGFALLRWFDEHRRDLPWRRERTPYRVWISEIMLQQTRVDTVVPYYVRFLKAFPTVADLASASEAEVLKLWEGLGYYRRARDLRRAAQQIVARFDGELPSDVEQLRTLPGIGPYTAGAIASIAFNVPAPAVDGNVLRVISRLAGVDDIITSTVARRRVENVVRSITPSGRASSMTEALMELGALVCSPRAPVCAQCPWQATCHAFQRNKVDALPRRRERVPPRIVEGAVAVVVRDDRVLVRRRPGEGLLAGMWEFPWFETNLVKSGTDAALAREVASEYGLNVHPTGSLSPVRHVFSHIEWRKQVFLFEADGADNGLGRWANRAELEQLAFGRAHRRIASEWLKGAGNDDH